MKKEIKLGITGLVELGGIALLVYFLTTGRAGTIINLHYSGWRAVVYGIGGMMAITAGYGSFLGVKIWQKKRRRVDSKASARAKAQESRRTQVARLDTPEQVYEYVSQAEKANPSSGFRMIRNQLDEMNSLQDRLKRLLELNGSTASLRETEELLQDIENAICLNVKKGINYLIVGGNDMFRNKLSKLVADNNELLSGATGILMDLAEFINSGKGDISAISRKIQDYRNSIKAYLKEEQEDEEDVFGSQEGSGVGVDRDSGLRARGM